MQIKWLNELKNAYKGRSSSTQLIAIGIGLVLLFSTGLFPIFALVYVLWIGKNWWAKRQVQKGDGFSNGNRIRSHSRLLRNRYRIKFPRRYHP